MVGIVTLMEKISDADGITVTDEHGTDSLLDDEEVNTILTALARLAVASQTKGERG